MSMQKGLNESERKIRTKYIEHFFSSIHAMKNIFDFVLKNKKKGVMFTQNRESVSYVDKIIEVYFLFA